MEVYISGRKISLKPSRSIGKGGEADVFDIGGGKALKLFKRADHPDYQGLPAEQQAAIARLQEHQQKLRHFPKNMPQRVVQPENLATDKQGKTILGYAMPLMAGTAALHSYGDRSFRTASGISNQIVTNIFRDMHETLKQIHAAQAVVGDFNDLNILVRKDEAYLIDSDSWQYRQFLCRVFTTRFVDPLLCDVQADRPILQAPYNPNSDWYAFTVMLMQSLLFVDPYGGVYKPKDAQARIPHDTRPLQRITVFHPEVRYPKPAIPYGILSDELLHQFHQCFVSDWRGEFPLSLLENLHWQKCPTCGVESARYRCPICDRDRVIDIAQTKPQTQVSSSNVTADPIFQTSGIILCATLDGDSLHWLYYERGAFKREDGSIVFTGDLDPQMRFWLHGKSTLVGKQGQVIALGDPHLSHLSPRLAVDSYREMPACDRNALGRYWLYNGQLRRDGRLGEEYIGDVLIDQTQFWVGSHFGFGFYRAGDIHVAFVFDAKGNGINDSVKLPPWQGQLIDADCVFGGNRCWLFLETQEQGRICRYVHVISDRGEAIATSKMGGDSHDWLTNIRGKFAVGNFLLAATDSGVVRLEPRNGGIAKVQEFPNTEPFVDVSSHLYASSQGLFAVNRNRIHLLKISS